MSFAYSPFLAPGGGPAGGGGTGPHALLSHVDTTTTATPSQSGMIVAETGAWKSIAHGTVGQVLRMGSAIPEWGSSYQGALVGSSGATYATLGAAVASGETVIQVIRNTSETKDIHVYQDTSVNIANGVTVNMSGYVFGFNGDQNLLIDGNGQLQFTSANVADRPFFSASGTNSLIRIEGINIVNTNPREVCVTDTSYARMSNVIFDGNMYVCGDYNIYNDCIYRNGLLVFKLNTDNSHIAGGVTQNAVLVDSGNNCMVSDLVVG